MKFNFNKDKRNGDRGERLIYNWLIKKKQIIDVEDVTKNPKYFSKGIDFIFTLKNGRKVSVDVKYDSSITRTGNVFLEVVKNNRTMEDGWFWTSEADFILIVFGGQDDKMLTLPLKEVRDYFKINQDRFKKVYGKWNGNSVTGEKWYRSIGYLIPYEELILNVNKCEIIEL
jgi:hypothetical protein